MKFKANSVQITKLRELTALSQEVFEERTRFSKRTLSMLENETQHRHSYSTFVRLAAAFTELLKESASQMRTSETQALRRPTTESAELVRQRTSDRRRLLECYLPVTADSLIDYETETSTETEPPYEFRALTNDITLDIRDRTGATVFYTKKGRIKILRDNAYYYVEDMSSDGWQSDFEVSPGVVDSFQEEEGKKLVKTTFGHQRGEGDEFDRVFRCIFHDSFCKKQEYWVQRQTYPTDQFSIKILFPSSRPPRGHLAVLKQGTYTKSCPQPSTQIIEGRLALVWDIRAPQFKESYKLQWEW